MRASAGRELDARIAARADEPFVTHVTWPLERTAGMEIDVGPELVLSDSGLPCDTFDIICRARIDGARVRAAALDAISHFARAERPFSWWVGPPDHPGNLVGVLATRAAFRGRGIGSMLHRRLGFVPFGEITEYKPGRIVGAACPAPGPR